MRADDLALLGLDRSEATRVAVKESFERIAPRYHPDTGGEGADPEKLSALVEARDRIIDELSRPVRCSDCKGAGVVTEMAGFVPSKVRCRTCRGLGTIPRA